MAKTVTFAACHFTVAFGVAYLLTGDTGISSLLALVEPACNTVAYYFHERAWIRFGGKQEAVKGSTETAGHCGFGHT